MKEIFKLQQTKFRDIDKTSINYNAGELYFYLYTIFSESEEFNAFCEYWLLLKNNDIKTFLGTLCLQLAYILIYGRQNEAYYMLPNIFCKELWRGQNLILELIKNKAQTKEHIIAEIIFWESAEAKYL